MALTISPWKYGKQWVYSITYDEALEELHHFAIPYHDELGIPGHVEAVAGHLGVVRQIGQSSYNGYHHMGPSGLRDLIARGWGVGNHTWSHELIQPDKVDREIGEAKAVLEEACGAPVPLYCAAGNNHNMSPHVLDACRKYGYLGAMSITDALNRPEDELFWLNRTALHEQMYEPFFNEYDPYRNIRYAQVKNKDCSAAQLRLRLETVLSEGGDAVWCANPDEVIYYHTTRRHTQIETVQESPTDRIYRLSLVDLPPQTVNTTLTFTADVPAAWCQNPHVWIKGVAQTVDVVRPGILRFTLPVTDGLEIALRPTRLDGKGIAS
jgi:hypothetical protein